jgi:hypothetical protein
MNPTIQRYLLSSLTTFLTVGSSALAVELASNSIQWTSTFWLSVVVVVVRAGFKAVVETFAAQHSDLVAP